MNILITGSEGFVGLNLQKYFSKSNNTIHLIDRISCSKKNYNKINLGKFNFSLKNTSFANAKIDLLIHLAAAKGDFMLSDDDFFNDNVLATQEVVKILEKLKIKNVIHYSTVSVYGHNNNLKNEQAKLNPNNAYGSTKLQSEKLLIKWFRKNKSNLTILRPSVIYGINNYANMYNLISLLNTKFPIMIGNGNYVKSMIAIENLVDITLFTIKRLNKLQIYNCTDEPYPTLKEVINYITEIKDFNKPVFKIPYNLALILALPFEFLSFLTKKDFRISRDRIYKLKMPTDYRSLKLREIGYIQKHDSKERIQNMALWFIRVNNKFN